MNTSEPIRASMGVPSGRTEMNGSFTGPNTFITRPRGRLRLSMTTAPLDAAKADRMRIEPS